MGTTHMSKDAQLRRVVIAVAALNLAYFAVEFTVARSIGSLSLFADSIDFLEDASINLLIAIGLGWSVAARGRLGMALAGILLLPAMSLLWVLWEKYGNPVPPEPFALTVTGLGALAVNLSCAFLLAGYRSHGGRLTKAAFLSARNDALANIAIIAAGCATAYSFSIWPDVVVGLGIAALNMDAAHDVWTAAHVFRAGAA